MKKPYQKPQAGYTAFYSNEEIASVQPLSNYSDPSIDVGMGTSASMGTGKPDWED